jgi:hypothetical protein
LTWRREREKRVEERNGGEERTGRIMREAEEEERLVLDGFEGRALLVRCVAERTGRERVEVMRRRSGRGRRWRASVEVGGCCVRD